MKPAANLREIVPGLWFWSSLPQQWKVESSSCAWEGKEGMVLAGDIVTNGQKGLAFLPDDYCKDAKLSRESGRKLLNLKFQTLIAAHGDPIHPKTSEQYGKLFGS